MEEKRTKTPRQEEGECDRGEEGEEVGIECGSSDRRNWNLAKVRRRSRCRTSYIRRLNSCC